MRYLILILFFAWSLLLKAQQPNDDIQVKNFYPEYLGQLIEDGINQFRKENNAAALVADEVLIPAAQDQSDYILKSGRVTHDQPIKKKATPFNRVIFYDGMHGQVGENCMLISIGAKVRVPGTKKMKIVKSYQDVADYAIQEWVKQKGGKEQLINATYTRIGTSFALDVKEEKIVITQLYASEPFLLPEGVKPTKNDYNIEPYNKSKCAQYESKYGYLPKLMSDNIYFKDGQIYFYFHDLELLKAVMDQPGDAIAIDIISRDQFECGEGNKYYPSEIHKGIMLPALSKSYIFGKNEIKDGNEVELSLGPIPDFVDTNNTEFNLLLIQDNCLCQTVVYNSLGGENLQALDLRVLMDTLSVSSAADSIMNVLTFSIPFERNKSQYSAEDIKPFLDSLSLNRYDLKKIEVIAYSSIEGAVEGNKIIQQKRAKSILDAIKKYKIQDVETKITTRENWEGFYESIKGSPYEEELKKFSKEQLRSIINSDSLDYNLEPYLEDQRMAKVIMTVEKIFMDEALFKVLPSRYEGALKNKEFAKAKVYQSVMINNIGAKRMSDEIFLTTKIPHYKESATLVNNQIAYRWYISEAENKDSLYKYLSRDIETMLRIDPTNTYLQYNKIVLRLLLWSTKRDREDPKYLIRDIKLLLGNSGIEKWQINRLILNFNIIAADYYYDNKKFREREKALGEVQKLLLSSKLDRDQTYRIANYFMFQLRIDWVIDLMKPWAEKEDIDEDFLFTFLTVAIYNKEKVPQEQYENFMKRAKEMNKDRFCKLFGFPNMSFQLLRDIPVKDMYCKTCEE